MSTFSFGYCMPIYLLYCHFVSLFGQCIDYKHIDNVGNGFTIGFSLHCVDESILLHVQYDNYYSNWFGIVFNDAMTPAYAAIFTTGKATEIPRAESVYTYHLEQKDINSVMYQPDMDSAMINQTIDTANNRAEFFYRIDLNQMPWSMSATHIVFRYAFGTSLTLQKHVKTSEIITYHMHKGTTSFSAISAADLKQLHLIHGVIMWLTWSLFAPIGIFSSRFRKIIEKHITQRHVHIHWFTVHRTVQYLVVGLTVAGFGVALYFTESHHGLQFNSTHKILGLIIVIITVLQPFNAIIRPHAAGKGEKKSIGRFCWEMFHKSSGYFVCIIGLINSFFGLDKPNVQKWKLYHLIWIIFLVLCYCGLWVYNYILKKKEKDVEHTPLINGKELNSCYTESLKHDDARTLN